MTSHEERAREWLLDHGVSDLCDDRDPATSLAAEFAAVEDATIGKCINDAQELERVLQKRVAVLEAALHQLARLGNGDRPGNSEGNVIAQRALSGEPTALLALLENAVEAGRIAESKDRSGGTYNGPHRVRMECNADIAKRVWESRSDDIVHREGR